MTTSDVAGLHEAVAALPEWQRDRAALQLHPVTSGFTGATGPQALWA